MNHQKVVQILKQIFDKYGIDIVCKPNNFRSAIFDLLDEWNYKEERLVLRNAIESNALLSLVTANPITNDITATAMEQLKKAGHMTEEDAEFIARCFIAARGGDPNIVTENIKKQQAEAEQKRQEEQRRQEVEQRQEQREEQRRQEAEQKQKQQEEQKRQETERKLLEEKRQEAERNQQQKEQKRQEAERNRLEEEKRQETERNQQEEEKKRYETEQKHQDNKDRNSSQEYIQTNQGKQESSSSIFEIECKRQVAGQLFGHLGKLYLYQDKLLFIPYKKKKKTEIFYRDITKFWTYQVVKWLLLIFMFLFALLWLGIEPVTGIMITVYFLIITPIWIRVCNRYIHIPNKWSSFRGCTFIFCSKADKKQAVAAFKERIHIN